MEARKRLYFVMCLFGLCVSAVMYGWVLAGRQEIKIVEVPRERSIEEVKVLMAYTATRYAEKNWNKVTSIDIKHMVDASFMCAESFPEFGYDTLVERAVSMMCFGYAETGWTANNVSYNLPGYTPGVRRFSVDVWWSGINELHFSRKYDIRGKALKLQLTGKVPKSIKLMWPPSAKQFKQAHEDYGRQKKAGVRPKHMKFSVKVDESGYDAFASALIYRVIVEMERRELGWEWRYWDMKAKTHLMKELAKYNLP